MILEGKEEHDESSSEEEGRFEETKLRMNTSMMVSGGGKGKVIIKVASLGRSRQNSIIANLPPRRSGFSMGGLGSSTFSELDNA